MGNTLFGSSMMINHSTSSLVRKSALSPERSYYQLVRLSLDRGTGIAKVPIWKRNYCFGKFGFQGTKVIQSQGIKPNINIKQICRQTNPSFYSPRSGQQVKQQARAKASPVPQWGIIPASKIPSLERCPAPGRDVLSPGGRPCLFIYRYHCQSL